MVTSLQLPPFAGLKAFEAAARHLSFSQAAKELNVSQSAVSHQIKSLESYLGVRLFNRVNAALQLTKEGQAYWSQIHDALNLISTATMRFRGQRQLTTLTISLLPTFATRWLIPRMARFQKQHPGIDVRLSANVMPVDFSRSDFDLAIRYGKGQWPGLYCKLLMPENLIPVCSPLLLKNNTRIEKPEDLKHFTLLHNLSHPGEWQSWLTTAGAIGVDTERGPGFESSDLALRAASEGMGIALGRRPLVDAELLAGSLVAPLSFQISSDSSYYFVCPECSMQNGNVKLFHDWLFQQIRPDTDTL